MPVRYTPPQPSELRPVPGVRIATAPARIKNWQRDDVLLVAFDAAGQEVLSIPGEKATDTQNGVFLFRLNLAQLPDPVRLEWHTSDGATHLAGPCSPSELRDALSTPDLARSQALVGDPGDSPNPPTPATPASDDVLVNIISDAADGTA